MLGGNQHVGFETAPTGPYTQRRGPITWANSHRLRQRSRQGGQMPNPTAAMLVIGDEILSGRTHDSNTHHLAGALTAAGIDLREVRVVSDDANAIIAAVQALSGAWDHVFTSGGIGPTHDDITADAVARAMGRSITVRADPPAIFAAHYEKSGTELNEARLRMARIPARARLIETPVRAAPGYVI